MVELTLNFVGVTATDFRRAFTFYTETLGVRPATTPPPDESASWAMLVAGWDESPSPDGRGLRCELFERDVDPPDERRWGHNQNVRPSILVADLSATRATLRERGVEFSGPPVDASRGGRSIEFAAHDGVRWSLARAPAYPAGPDLRTPHIGWLELKVADVDGQLDFYTRVMGLSVGERADSRVRLEQAAGRPRLFLEPGGERVTAEGERGSPFDAQPVWMSFETSDITAAADWLTANDVTLVRDVTAHDWGGADVVIRDPDGNPIQVVEYHDA